MPTVWSAAAAHLSGMSAFQALCLPGLSEAEIRDLLHRGASAPGKDLRLLDPCLRRDETVGEGHAPLSPQRHSGPVQRQLRADSESRNYRAPMARHLPKERFSSSLRSRRSLVSGSAFGCGSLVRNDGALLLLSSKDRPRSQSMPSTLRDGPFGPPQDEGA